MEATPSMIKFCHTALILNDKNVQLMSPFGILRKREREEMEKEGGKERAKKDDSMVDTYSDRCLICMPSSETCLLSCPGQDLPPPGRHTCPRSQTS